MFRKITTIISFKIENKFEESLEIFDSKEADHRYSEFAIKSFLDDSVKMILKKLFAYIMLWSEILKSLFKQIVNGLKFTNLISQI